MKSGECRKCSRRMAVYLAGEMNASEAAEMNRHLADCPGCAKELVSLAETAARLDRAAEEVPAPPAGLAARAVARAREKRAAGGAVGWWHGWLGYPGLAGAVVAAVFTLLLVGPVREDRTVPLPGSNLRDEMKNPSPGGQGEMHIMMKGGEAGPEQSIGPAKADSWVAVFSGDSRTGQEAAGKLAQAGIRHQLKTGPSGAWITVPPEDLDRAKQILFAADTP